MLAWLTTPDVRITHVARFILVPHRVSEKSRLVPFMSKRLGHAADFCNAQFKACVVASEVIADQLPVPVAEEISSMFASTARAEVVNDRRQIGELTGGIGPDVSTMSFLRARRQHLYRRFVSTAPRSASTSG